MKTTALSIRQMAAELGVNRSVVLRYIRDGRLPALLTGSRGGYRVEQKDWADFKATLVYSPPFSQLRISTRPTSDLLETCKPTARRSA